MGSLYRKDRRLKPVIAKQMEAHTESNTKSAFIFSLTTAFLVFAVSNMQSIGQFVITGAMVHIGSTLGLVPANLGFFKEPQGSPKITNLDEAGMNAYLDSQKDSGRVEEYSYIYAMLDSTMLNSNEVYNPLLSVELGSADSGTAAEVKVYGIEENFLASTYSEFYSVSSQTPECDANPGGIISEMYRQQGRKTNHLDDPIDGRRIYSNTFADFERVEAMRY
jgi:hypothetical protein